MINPHNSLAKFTPESSPRYTTTDIGNSNLFADYCRDVTRYVPERKMWYIFTGKLWEPDIGNLQAMELCKKLADELVIYALSLPEGREHNEYRKAVERWQIRHYREIILKDAMGIYPAKLSDFDSKPYLFNCKNGTLDLHTRAFHEHNPTDMLVAISGVKYDPEARSELWERTIRDVMQGDVDLACYLLLKANDVTIFSSGRVKVLPFNRHFSPQEQDKTLKKRLEKELSGVLNWCLEGLWLMQKTGFEPPESVQCATQKYQHDSDKLARFVEEMLILNSDGEARTEDVYREYRGWCQHNGQFADGYPAFKQSMEGYAQIRKKRPRGAEKSVNPTAMFCGIQLKMNDSYFRQA